MRVVVRTKDLAKGYCTQFLDIHAGGKRRSEFVPGKFKKNPSNAIEAEEKKELIKLAEYIASKRRLELLRRSRGIEEAYNTNIDFIAYAENYIRNHTAKEIKKFIAVLKKFIAFAGKSKVFCFEIDEAYLKKFVLYLQKHLKGESPANYFAKFKQIIKSACADRHFISNPAEHIRVRKTVFLYKAVLSHEEVQLLNNTPLGNNMVKNAFLFCTRTGLRHCDVKILTWKNIIGDQLHLIQQKTKVPLIIPLSPDAVKFLPERGNPDDLIFPLPSHTACQKWLKKWTKDAELDKHLTWHSSRHTFGTNLIAYGVDVSIASKLLGHTSLVNTQRYVRVNETMKEEAIAKLPSI